MTRTGGRHVVWLLLVAWMAVPGAQRTGYPAGEFIERRERLANALGRGTLVMFGATTPAPGVRFRQDHDFYYLTGNESLNAVLVMDVASRAADLFLPVLSATEIRFDGPNWLDEPDAARRYGFASVRPLGELPDVLASRRLVEGAERLWTRLSERDEVNFGRTDIALQTARRATHPFGQHPTEDEWRAAALRERYPFFDLHDVTPHVDRLRLIKTPREIEILRRIGRISAEAIERAIRATAPGRFEYEIEAEATYWLFRHGAQAAAYPAIVASGPMGNRWHYEDSGRRMQAGELVVMDYGGSLDYMTMDITRTWPVSGRFTADQLAAYRTVLEAQTAILAAIRPGVTRAAVRTVAERIYRRHGFDPRYAYLGHYVGMSVHDVGDWDLPFEAGMVLAIEPILDLPEQAMHVRIEDTILVTGDGVEVLSAAVAKDVEGILALVGTR
jgi:Xaa-Pro aminopeptidase